MKISVFTLGCKVNESESASIRQGLSDAGFTVEEGLVFADVFILNTCAVTAEAEKKSRQAVARIKKINPNAKILVTGCASQRDGLAFLDKEGVLFVCGAQQKYRVIEKIKQLANEEGFGNAEPQMEICEESTFCELPVSRAVRTRADVKIQDGCNNFCAYCLIPYLRGRERSRSIDSIRQEVLALNEPETVITGINVSAYQAKEGGLTELLRALQDVPSRIRLGSLEVRVITPEFLQAASEMKNFAPHFHLSLQSGDDGVLADMNRKYTTAQYREKVMLIREYFPNAAITTDIIAGFPTETEERFENSFAFAKNMEFADIHAFPFSARVGTRAAKLPDLPKEVKKARTERLLALAEHAKDVFYRKNLGKVFTVIVEESNHGFSYGYTENYIRTKIPETLLPGSYPVQLIKTENGVCIGKRVDR